MATDRVKFTNPAHYTVTQLEQVTEFWLRLHWVEHGWPQPECGFCAINSVLEFRSAVIESLARHLGVWWKAAPSTGAAHAERDC